MQAFIQPWRPRLEPVRHFVAIAGDVIAYVLVGFAGVLSLFASCT